MKKYLCLCYPWHGTPKFKALDLYTVSSRGNRWCRANGVKRSDPRDSYVMEFFFQIQWTISLSLNPIIRNEDQKCFQFSQNQLTKSTSYARINKTWKNLQSKIQETTLLVASFQISMRRLSLSSSVINTIHPQSRSFPLTKSSWTRFIYHLSLLTLCRGGCSTLVTHTQRYRSAIMFMGTKRGKSLKPKNVSL